MNAGLSNVRLIRPVMIFGGSEIIDGKKSVGEFMSFFTAMALIFEPLRRLSNVAGCSQVALASMEKIYTIFLERSKILDPIRLPKEIFCSLFMIATIEVDNSGILVPKAIIVTPIILSLIPSFEAKLTAPLINTSDPSHKKKLPKINKENIFKNFILVSTSIS